MTTIVTRAGKGTPLTHQEMDDNFTNLNTDKLEASNIHAATSKTTPVDADELPLVDSAASFALKKLTWANLKSTVLTYITTALTSGTSILKGNGTGGFSNAVSGTDYLAPPSGTSILKANSGGALADAVAGTDYLAPAAIGTTVQGYDVDTAKLDVEQTWTQVQRTNELTDNDGSFDLDAGYLDFKCTPSAGVTLTFTNIPATTLVQKGTIVFINGSNYAIAAHANTKISAADLAKISATGTYLLSYRTSAGVAYVVSSASLA